MPLPIAVVAIGGLLAGGYALREGSKFLDEMNEGAKLALIAGGAYVSYRALKSSGVLK